MYQTNTSYETKNIQSLPLEYIGITINNQDIDLMMIANSNNIEELKEALSKITNIKVPLTVNDISEQDFIFLRQQIFEMYLNQLVSENDYFKNRGIALNNKIKYLIASGKLSQEEIIKLTEIITSSNNKEEIINKLNNTFPKEKIHEIYEVMRDFSPIEKEGIKSSSLETYQNLLYQIQNNYNSITIDQEVKYGSIVLQDGTFDFRHLKKSLNFAKSQGKKVRLNALIFYMDCPEELYNLDKTEENRAVTKQKLAEYIFATTAYIKENGYSDTVRSIDILNELLNRFPLSKNPPYSLRGNIPQDKDNNFDNIASGWLKHLTVEDLCDIIAIARKNLPNTDFMYNDDNLTDPKKIESLKEIMQVIKNYEKEHNVKIIDSIGSQMHIDNNITKEQINESITKLSVFELPIEITEFDIAMTHITDNHSDLEIEELRQEKMNEIYECIDEQHLKSNIRGFTIWSKTDKQNFRLSIENERRIQNGQEPLKTLHGGFFTNEMTSKSDAVSLEKSKESNKKLIRKKYDSGHIKFTSIPLTICLIFTISIMISYILHLMTK